MNNPFHFKQFTIHQDKCAMKVGTDGVLLGAWASISFQPNTILDIGAGTGLIALMLAQRSNAQTIDALEIDPLAYEQCVENFEASAWNDRLFCYHASLAEFTEEMDDTYDLIISNPPFFTENVSSKNHQRDQARASHFLPFEELLAAVSKLLSKNGRFHVIIPYKEEAHFIDLALKESLHLSKATRVKGTPSSEIKRSLLEFTFSLSTPETTEICIETERHQYTQEYIALTKDFYLKM